MTRVAIVTGGYFPVPPAKGGAVEALDQYLVEQNEERGELDLVVYSCDDPEARREASRFTRTSFVFVRTPTVVRAADHIVYFLAKNVLRKEKHMSYRYIFQRLHFIRKVGKGLAEEPVDRILFENHPTLLMALRVAGNRERYAGKYDYHMHNSPSGFFGCEEEFLGCRKVIGVSRYILGEAERLTGGRIDASRLVVLRNRVDDAAFSGRIDKGQLDALRENLGIPAGAKVVLFGGRLCSEKGALELVQAFGRLRDASAVLLVLGSYYYGSKMKSEYEERLGVAAESLGDRIKFTGFVEHEKMPLYYALADCVAAPSVWDDPAPLAVIEPLTAGKPLVTTAMGGIPEYATDGVDSVVLPLEGDFVDRLAAAIDGVLDGSIVLNRNEAADWGVTGYYDDFLGLMTEDDLDG